MLQRNGPRRALDLAGVTPRVWAFPMRSSAAERSSEIVRATPGFAGLSARRTSLKVAARPIYKGLFSDTPMYVHSAVGRERQRMQRGAGKLEE